MQEDSVGSVCENIWKQHFNCDEDPSMECVSALKAIVCVPGALYELSQDDMEARAQQTVGGSPRVSGAQLLEDVEHAPQHFTNLAPPNCTKPEYSFLETLLIPPGSNPGTHLISLASFQDAVWLSLNPPGNPGSNPGHYMLAMLLTVVMLALSALAGCAAMLTNISPYVVLLPALGLGPFIGVLVIMALDAQEETLPTAKNVAMARTVPNRAAVGGPETSLGSGSSLAKGFGLGAGRLGLQSSGPSSSSSVNLLENLMSGGRRLRASSNKAKGTKGPHQEVGGGSTSQLPKLVPSAMGSLDGKSRFIGRGSLEAAKPGADAEARPLTRRGGSLDRQNKYDPRSSLDAMGRRERGSMESRGGFSIPENEVVLQADLLQQQQKLDQQQAEEERQSGRQQQQQGQHVLDEQQQQQEQEQEQQREACSSSPALTSVGKTSGLRRSLDMLLHCHRGKDSSKIGTVAEPRPRGVSIDNHSLFGGDVWKGGSQRSRLRVVGTSTSSSDEGSDSTSSPWNIRARDVYEAALKERAGKVMAVLLSPLQELNAADVRQLYEELEGNELQQLPCMNIDDVEAERELEELSKAKEAAAAREAQEAAARAKASVGADEEANRRAAEEEAQRQRERRVQEDIQRAAETPFKPRDPTKKAYTNTDWTPHEQELAEFKVYMEHKQAKARAQWHQSQAKQVQGQLFKSVMGDRELFYQANRDDAADDDDAPIIRHSPLIEEQLAAARAEAEAEAAEAQRRADASAMEAQRQEQTKAAAAAAEAARLQAYKEAKKGAAAVAPAADKRRVTAPPHEPGVPVALSPGVAGKTAANRSASTASPQGPIKAPLGAMALKGGQGAAAPAAPAPAPVPLQHSPHQSGSQTLTEQAATQQPLPAAAQASVSNRAHAEIPATPPVAAHNLGGNSRGGNANNDAHKGVGNAALSSSSSSGSGSSSKKGGEGSKGGGGATLLHKLATFSASKKEADIAQRRGAGNGNGADAGTGEAKIDSSSAGMQNGVKGGGASAASKQGGKGLDKLFACLKSG